MSPPYPLCCPYPRVSVTAADLSFHSAWMTFPEMSIHPLHPLQSKRISILINYQLKEVVFSIGVSGVRGHYLKCSSLTSRLGHQSTPLSQLSSDWVSKKHSNFFFQKNLNEIIGYRVMYRCLHRTTILALWDKDVQRNLKVPVHVLTSQSAQYSPHCPYQAQ